MHLSKDELQNLGMAVFMAAGASEKNAKNIVDALVAAELEGMPSHGFSRIPFYLDQAASGKVKIDAVPVVSHSAASAITVDAGFGFAFPAIETGLEAAIPVAKQNGICGMGVANSHHCGILGFYAEKIAALGLVSLIFSNTPSAMAPWGGSKPTFGTNPIAFGCPRQNGQPLVIDLSLSKVARGKIMTARQQNQKIPLGWALDANGKDTEDPEAALGGSMIPMGDAKGASLALMVEILSAALTNSNYAFEASSFFEAKGTPPGIGQFFILIHPEAFNPGFSAKLETLFQTILAQQGTRLSGSRRQELRRKKSEAGVDLPNQLYENLQVRLKK